MSEQTIVQEEIFKLNQEAAQLHSEIMKRHQTRESLGTAMDEFCKGYAQESGVTVAEAYRQAAQTPEFQQMYERYCSAPTADSAPVTKSGDVDDAQEKRSMRREDLIKRYSDAYHVPLETARRLFKENGY